MNENPVDDVSPHFTSSSSAIFLLLRVLCFPLLKQQDKQIAEAERIKYCASETAGDSRVNK